MVRLEAPADLPAVEADGQLLRAAVAEVVLNALQAGSSGEAAASAAPQEVVVQVRHDALDAQAVIQVTDHGPGMTEETVRQAFAPFFSAKRAGRQRGMGLAKALRWIESHGGMIRLDSALGVGTTAVIILPLGRLDSAASASGNAATPENA